MKVIIAGSRSVENYAAIEDAMDECLLVPMTVVCGCATGVDRMGAQWARRHSIPIIYFPAWNGQFDWADEFRHGHGAEQIVFPDTVRKAGRGAGMIRNGHMADYADALVAIWDGKSRGTADMIHAMKGLRKPVHVFSYSVDSVR